MIKVSIRCHAAKVAVLLTLTLTTKSTFQSAVMRPRWQYECDCTNGGAECFNPLSCGQGGSTSPLVLVDLIGFSDRLSEPKACGGIKSVNPSMYIAVFLCHRSTLHSFRSRFWPNHLHKVILTHFPRVGQPLFLKPVRPFAENPGQRRSAYRLPAAGRRSGLGGRSGGAASPRPRVPRTAWSNAGAVW